VEAGVLRVIPTPQVIRTDWKTRTKDCLEVLLRGGEDLRADTATTGPFAPGSAVAKVIDTEGGDRRKDRRDVVRAIGDLIDEGVIAVDVRTDKNRNERRFLRWI
jgi:hypothetical protein